jgi:2-keto-4-pentenoate hydratase
MIELDPRVRAGMDAQLALRRERLAAGDRHLGWKVGFGAPEAIERLGTDRPLVGFLTHAGLLDDGAEVAVGDWAAPALEPEIAVHLAADVPGDAAWSDVRDAVAGLSAAIELADVSFPPDDVRRILAGNIFQRHVLLGPVRPDVRDGSGVRARVVRDGEEIARTDNPAAITGEVLEVVRLTAELLAAVGERLRAGDVVITGSVVPPVQCAPGQAFAVELEPLGRLAARLV